MVDWWLVGGGALGAFLSPVFCASLNQWFSAPEYVLSIELVKAGWGDEGHPLAHTGCFLQHELYSEN